MLAEPNAEGCAAAAGAGKDVANDANGLGAAKERVWMRRRRKASSLLRALRWQRGVLWTAVWAKAQLRPTEQVLLAQAAHESVIPTKLRADRKWIRFTLL